MNDVGLKGGVGRVWLHTQTHTHTHKSLEQVITTAQYQVVQSNSNKHDDFPNERLSDNVPMLYRKGIE